MKLNSSTSKMITKPKPKITKSLKKEVVKKLKSLNWSTSLKSLVNITKSSKHSLVMPKTLQVKSKPLKLL